MNPLLWLALAPAAAFAPGEVAVSADRDRLLSHLEALTGHAPLGAGDPVTSRSIHHPDCDRVADWLVEALAGIDGLVVATETFSAEGEGGLRNVVAELTGAEPDRAPIVLGAHYDSIADLDPEPWDAAIDAAPGADDDASGVATVLEAARLLAADPDGFSRTIRFVLFSAEEVGLVGSFHHVAERGDEGTALALILDPVGYDPGGGGILWFSYDQRWSAEAEAFEAQGLALAPALDVWGVDHETFGGDARSDHWPFWEADLPALHLGTFPQPPTYHTRSDTLDVVDVDFVAAVAGLAAAHAGELAGEPPVEEPRLLGCAVAGASSPAWWLALLAAVSGSSRTRSRPRAGSR